MNADPESNTCKAALEVKDLTITYDTEKGPLHTVRDVSMQIAPGEIYGLVGESGSGKTTLAWAVVNYLPANGRVSAGLVLLDGIELLKMRKPEMRKVWGAKITMVHQDPNTAVNPSILIGEQIAEMARHSPGNVARRRQGKVNRDVGQSGHG